jgi:hypothetical protein
MNDDLRRRLRAAILEERKRPPEERWQKMIDSGFIDEKGNVLLPSIAPTYCPLEPDPEAVDDGQPEPKV